MTKPQLTPDGVSLTLANTPFTDLSPEIVEHLSYDATCVYGRTKLTPSQLITDRARLRNKAGDLEQQLAGMKQQIEHALHDVGAEGYQVLPHDTGFMLKLPNPENYPHPGNHCAPIEKIIELEQARWQDRLHKIMHEAGFVQRFGNMAAGNDSGDPLDYTADMLLILLQRDDDDEFTDGILRKAEQLDAQQEPGAQAPGTPASQPRPAESGSPTVAEVHRITVAMTDFNMMALCHDGNGKLIAAYPVTLPEHAPADSPDRLTLRPSVAAFAQEMERLLRDDNEDQANWRSRSFEEHKDAAKLISSVALDQIRKDEYSAAAVNIAVSCTHLLFLWDKLTGHITDPSPGAPLAEQTTPPGRCIGCPEPTT